jgi:hypothetical protein
MGIFYDERTNRKIMTHLRHSESPSAQREELSNP